MRQKWTFIMGLLIFTSALLAACGTNSAAPGVTSQLPTASNPAPSGSASNVTNSNSSTIYESQTVEGGSVTVQVTPLAIKMGAPLEFEIAMNTHSVDLGADMLKMVVLRDDSGMEFTPTAWDGPSGGGHHREGRIKFAPLTMNSKSLTLVVKNIAGLPERVYKWELTQ